jgi:hypothetical protein
VDLAGSLQNRIEEEVDGVSVREGPGRRRQFGVAESLRPVRLGRRLERAHERDLATERDLDVGPPGELEDPLGVGRHLAGVDIADTQVAATSSVSGDAAAYRSARAVVDARVDIEDQGRRSVTDPESRLRPGRAPLRGSGGRRRHVGADRRDQRLPPCRLLGEEGRDGLAIRRSGGRRVS